MTRIIEIVISPDGQTTVETKGFQGESCREASRFMEESLGRHVGEKLTAEFHQKSSLQQPNHQKR